MTTTGPREDPESGALLRKVDCIQLAVRDLDEAIAFYGRLGHPVVWLRRTQAGLGMPETDAELVLQTDRSDPEVDLLVKSVDAAVTRFVEAGGRVVEQPFDVEIGRCAVVEDPWSNRIVLIDMKSGPLKS